MGNGCGDLQGILISDRERNNEKCKAFLGGGYSGVVICGRCCCGHFGIKRWPNIKREVSRRHASRLKSRALTKRCSETRVRASAGAWPLAVRRTSGPKRRWLSAAREPWR